MSAARIHPGAVIHVWDHLVITLRDGDRETVFLSWYSIRWSRSLGAGNVALLEVPGGRAGRDIAVTFADVDGLGDRMQARLRAMGLDRPATASPPVRATFDRSPFQDGAFGVRIGAPRMTVEAHWREVGEPFWMDGQGGGFSPTEDIWAVFVEAPRASVSLDADPVPGTPFDDDVWVPKLGRSLSSAHGAFSEVRVAPVASG